MKAAHPGADPVLGFARRARLWILTGLTLGLTCGLGLYVLAPAIYHATVAVEVSELAPTISLSPAAARIPLVTIDTDAQLIASDAVVTSIAAVTGEPAARVRARLSIAARPLTRILEITFVGSSPTLAAVGAEQAAATFLAERHRLMLQPAEKYLRTVADQTQDPTPAGDALATANLSKAPDVRPENLRERAVQARVELPGPGSVVEHARVLSSPDRGDAEIPLVSGAAFGALLGFGLGVARDVKRT